MKGGRQPVSFAVSLTVHSRVIEVSPLSPVASGVKRKVAGSLSPLRFLSQCTVA